jgi:predicted DsbA family dithiol-disulfide isomerase
MRHLKMMMDAEGLPFGEDRYMTFNSRLAQELAKWAEEKPESEPLKIALYQAYFVEGRNIGDVDELIGVAKQVGLPVDEARDVLEQRVMQAAIDADWRYALSVGVSAVPTFAVGLTGMAGARPYEQLAQFLEQVGATKR